MLTRSGKERERSQRSTEDEEPKENPLHQETVITQKVVVVPLAHRKKQLHAHL